eukprot:CAMPEP_0174264052 /NCGR_PEP_ID=MMETSP0439-20130205/21141_1 /TAXON_ID=0 /ORGANISM="Stereomyxa ramosa, Strain Chinc5" /LENGTH=106 /DNA_ID=CAMNT_0015349753 /DNA_START=395 /DNA_END=715 /DNA_ORIENTATION=-
MRTALHAKFSQNLFLAKALVLTGNKILGEVGGRGGPNHWTCGRGSSNMLGVMLMELRDRLKLSVDVSDILRQQENSRLEAELEIKRKIEMRKKKKEMYLQLQQSSS